MTVQQFLGIVKRRAVIVVAVVAAGLVLMYAFRNVVPNSFVGVSHVVLVAESGARDPSVSIVDLPSIATSTVVLERVRKSLKLPMSLINLKANVSASILGRSSIMSVGFRDRSAERAIGVSNAVANELSRYYDEISTQRYDVNVSRLSTELAAEAAKIQSIDQQISKVVASNPYVVSDKSVDDITTELAQLQEQRASAFGQLKSDQAVAESLAPNPILAKAAQHEILADDPAYLAARDTLGHDRAQLASDMASYTRNYPGYPGAVAKIANESMALAGEEQRAVRDPSAYSPSANGAALQRRKQLGIVGGDIAHLQQLDDLISMQETRLGALPTIGAQFSQLSAQRDALQTEYTALATRRANALANRAEASSLGSVVVLDRAIKADTQLAGGRTRAAVVALVFILAVAFGLAIGVDSLDPRIRRPEEIEQLYGIPVVANFGARA